MTRSGIALALALLAVSAAPAARVPFVGCAMDGQTGPIAAPRAGRTPDVAEPNAARLAFYATAADGVAPLGVLAPRGWHCFGAYGSNGQSLYVAPAPIAWHDIFDGPPLRGPIVQLSYSFGDTSGRFEVAAIAARLFPAAHNYVAGIEKEGIFEHPLDRRPFPGDRVTHRGPYRALFTTPAGRQGLGTQSRLAPGALPIDGVAILDLAGDAGLTMLTARLPAADRPLVAPIIAQVSGRQR